MRTKILILMYVACLLGMFAVAVGAAHAQNTTPNAVTITWTAPGDDGNVGRAHSYLIQLKRASQTAWTSLLAGPVPQVAGSTETARIASLTPDSTYDIRIQACDEVPNCGGFSNILRVVMPSQAPRDTTAPGAPVITIPTGALMHSHPLRTQERWVARPEQVAVKP